MSSILAKDDKDKLVAHSNERCCTGTKASLFDANDLDVDPIFCGGDTCPGSIVACNAGVNAADLTTVLC